ncbi:CynX/NimT family MFS transporter [Paenibacillus popilliae]|uniref:Permease n=1 Tax=Paenibacillus popilliae ATCC 14706 TaxID=1212764 RepID=M9LJA7_PAEPP|nr:MFS transporter [Paenibacillus popilliae]GAC43275.1 permease [Paenibacillus popilliae ATCC 14706]
MLFCSINYSTYRWVMLILSALTALVPTIVFVGPTVFIPMMMTDLNITTAEAGVMVTIVLLGAGLTGSIGGPLMGRIGIKHTRTVAMLFYTLGGLVPLFTSSYIVLLMSRILIGIGMGIAAGTSVAVTMDWYPPKERPLINSLNSVLSLAGAFIALAVAIPIYNLVGQNWKLTLEWFGVAMLITTVLWILFARNNVKARMDMAPRGQEKRSYQTESLLKSVIKRKEVILLVIAYLSFMLSTQSLQTFLPTYFQTDLGMSAAKSGTITSLISLASVVAGLIVGILMAALGRRKIFMWPLLTLLLVGCIGSVTLSDGMMLYVSVILIGLALDGWLPAMFTSLMELGGMTPERAGAAQGLILSVGMFGGAVSTLVIGWLAAYIGLRDALLYFSFLTVFAIISTAVLPETGPKGRNKR